jgi:hypothetical protein
MGLKLYLKKAKSWDVVTGTATRPNLTGTDTALIALVDAWVAKDDSAKYHIMATINKEQQNKLFRLNDDASSKTFWDLLARENKPTGEVGLQVLLSQLHSCRYVNGASMVQHHAHMRSLTIPLASIGEPVSDATFPVLVKGSLPSSWDTITFILDGSTTMDKEAVMLESPPKRNVENFVGKKVPPTSVVGTPRPSSLSKTVRVTVSNSSNATTVLVETSRTSFALVATRRAISRANVESQDRRHRRL